MVTSCAPAGPARARRMSDPCRPPTRVGSDQRRFGEATPKRARSGAREGGRFENTQSNVLSLVRCIIHNVEHNLASAAALGEFEQLVLIAVLRLGSDAYGATIRREIEARAHRRLSISAVYTTLERLEQKGYIRSWIGEPTPQRGGRRRKHVDLLPLGARALKVAYSAFTGMTAGVERRLKAL
jgi:PadR family transcriptional regulator, regulatory protein PadR